MADLRVHQVVDNDIYGITLEISKESISQDDKARIKKFGEPEINIGGIYGSGGNQVTLPDEYVKIVSDFSPYVKEFDSRTAPYDSNTTTKVESVRSGVVTKWQTAFTTLRALTDTFTKELIVQI